MIDNFTVVLPHVLMAIAIWRLLRRDDLDQDPILPGTTEALGRLKRGFAKAQGSAKQRNDAQPAGKQPDGKPPRA
jgi:hypothetical protein